MKHFSAKAADALISIIDGIGAALFVSTIFIILQTMLFRPHITPNDLRENASVKHGISRGSTWEEVAEKIHHSAVSAATGQLNISKQSSLSTISKLQQDNWPKVAHLDLS